MPMTVEKIFLMNQRLMNIDDGVYKELEQEIRLLELESPTKELHIETLLDRNAVDAASIKYLLIGIFLMFDRKKTLSYDETALLIEIAKLDTETYETELINEYVNERNSEDRIISELEMSFLMARTRVKLLLNFLSLMSDNRFSEYPEVYLNSAEQNIVEVNKYMSFYSEKILKEYYGIS